MPIQDLFRHVVKINFEIIYKLPIVVQWLSTLHMHFSHSQFKFVLYKIE